MPEQPWILPIPCVSCRETIITLSLIHISINGGTFTGVQGAVSASIGYLEVNGGTFKTVACEHHGTAATFYALYAAGEAGKVLCVINDGYFETEGRQTAVLICNDNTCGDGAINAPATGIVRGGTFVAPVGAVSYTHLDVYKKQVYSGYMVGWYIGTCKLDGLNMRQNCCVLPP